MSEKKRRNREMQKEFQAKRKEGYEEAMKWRQFFGMGKPFTVGFTVDDADNLVPVVFVQTDKPTRAITTAMKAMDKPLVSVFLCLPISEEQLLEQGIAIEPRTKVF